MTFRAGDIVRHLPTGKVWVLIVDEHNGMVTPGGWPVSWGAAIHCELIKAASDDERIEQLKETAKSKHPDRRIAASQLAAKQTGVER